MENIFENAHFGKTYKTRDGRKAIYIGKSKIDKDAILIAYEDSTSLCRVMKDGHYWATPNVETNADIISEYQEEIDELELGRKFVEFYNSDEFRSMDTPYFYFSAGYRKAKEE